MPEPIDKALYERVKRRVKARVKVWPSAYASGQLVSEYKRLGGRYRGQRKGSNLGRWYKEDWRNVCKRRPGGGYAKCGRKRSNIRNYPYCRPRVRVSSTTPKTISELGKARIKRMCYKKRQSMRRFNGLQTRVYIGKKKSRSKSRRKSRRKSSRSRRRTKRRRTTKRRSRRRRK